MPKPKRSAIDAAGGEGAQKPRLVVVKPEPVEILEPLGGTKARMNCPLCGMMADVYRNRKQPRIKGLQGYPHEIRSFRMHYGGFRWNEGRKRREGIIQYEEADEALLPLKKILLAHSYHLCQQLVRELGEEGVELPKGVAEAVKALGPLSRLWKEYGEEIGEVDDRV